MKITVLFALSAFSGILLGFGWPHTGSLTPLLFIGLVPLLIVEDRIVRDNHRGVFGYAYITFFLWNLITTWWIYCVDEDMVTKLVSVGSAVLINPLFMAIVFKLFHNAKKRLGTVTGYAAFIMYWLTFEYIHFNWDLSYPWLTLGNGLSNAVKLVQWYEFTGVLGGSLWILLANVLIFTLIKRTVVLKDILTKNLRLTLVLLFIIVVPMVGSLLIYNNYREVEHPVEVTIIQPNADPYATKFNVPPDQQMSNMLNMASTQVSANTKYVVGPETALPRSMWIHDINRSKVHGIIRNFVEKFPQINVVLGASLRDIYESEEEAPPTARKFSDSGQWFDHFNSALQINRSEDIPVYHKSKLVLGVEKMPFPSLFQPFQEMIFDLGGTTGSLGTQEERSVFAAYDDTIKIAPVICWESIYGEFLTEYIAKGAHLIFIMTNDGWWDDTPGYHQHLAYARIRAIETRRSIARSANTGISCFINQRGDVLQPTKWWIPTVISNTINANDLLTFYSRHGDFLGRVSAFFSVLLLIWVIVKRFSKRK